MQLAGLYPVSLPKLKYHLSPCLKFMNDGYFLPWAANPLMPMAELR